MPAGYFSLPCSGAPLNLKLISFVGLPLKISASPSAIKKESLEDGGGEENFTQRQLCSTPFIVARGKPFSRCHEKKGGFSP